MRILLLGGTDLTLAVGERLRKIDLAPVGLVYVGQEFKISYSSEAVINVRFTDLASWCEGSGIPARKYEGAASIAALADQVHADFCLAAGWFHMVPADLRARFARGTAGLHASLLPKLRGGAPLNWAILSGESETGVTLFALGDGVDDGPIYGQQRFPIGPRTTIADLVSAAEASALTLVERCVPAIATSKLTPTPQSGEPSYCLQRRPEDGAIDWSQPAEQIDRLVRAVGRPYPGAFTYFGGSKVMLWAVEPRFHPPILGAPGQIARVADKPDPVVVTGHGSIVIRDATDESGEDLMRLLRRSSNKRFEWEETR